MEETLREKILEFFRVRFQARDKNFGNARLARNLFQFIYLRQTSRISQDIDTLRDQDFQILKVDDWPDAETLSRVY